MPFHISRFIWSFKKITGKNASAVLETNVDDYNRIKTPIKKAKFIKKLITDLLAKTSEPIAKKIMYQCGSVYNQGISQCVAVPMITKVKKLSRESKSIKDFINKLNQHHIGGGNLRLKGNVITTTYERCYCGAVSKTKEKIPITYCYCGAGWYSRLFEEALSKSVKVKVIQTIANGADICKFEIHI
jgi:predicted hydrocarbon binding protein